jgi:hypothetical protein
MVESDTYNVNAPIGGFGNHVRALLFLSDKFPISFKNKIVAKEFDKKLELLKKYYYQDKKTWHNWLSLELKWRHQFDKEIVFSHFFEFIKNNKNKNAKIIALSVDPELCHRCYFKFNSNLNIISSPVFLNSINLDNKELIELAKKDSRILLIDASHIFSPTLDRKFYNSIIQWFDVEDRYETANELHGTWYNLHVKAEQEFVQYVNELYNNACPK